MAKSNTAMIGVAVVALGGVAWWYLAAQKDKTPVGLVVINAIESGHSLGETSDGKALTAGAVEGTWRADEDSLSVASESAEKPLMVIYEDGTPIHAEVITISEWALAGQSDTLPSECYDDDGNVYEDWPQECEDAFINSEKDSIDKWRTLAKEHGATDESIEALFPTLEESTTQEAESIFGPMLSLQSHFVW
tara:strand:+ start:2186 stop:2761 length:576 start_codon:yes stop_codon:yes gene_type:complete